MKKPIIVALIATSLDYFVHQNYANPEVPSYYIFKIILYFIASYYILEPNKIRDFFNVFKLKDRTTPFYLYFSLLGAFYHGLYYRMLDWYYGSGFLSFARVGDVRLFNFSSNIFIEGILDWALIHGLSFFVALYVARFLGDSN